MYNYISYIIIYIYIYIYNIYNYVSVIYIVYTNSSCIQNIGPEFCVIKGKSNEDESLQIEEKSLSSCRREIPMKMSPCRREIPMGMVLG